MLSAVLAASVGCSRHPGAARVSLDGVKSSVLRLQQLLGQPSVTKAAALASATAFCDQIYEFNSLVGAQVNRNGRIARSGVASAVGLERRVRVAGGGGIGSGCGISV